MGLYNLPKLIASVVSCHFVIDSQSDANAFNFINHCFIWPSFQPIATARCFGMIGARNYMSSSHMLTQKPRRDCHLNPGPFNLEPSALAHDQLFLQGR